jgi:excisionase family DNA binding protein
MIDKELLAVPDLQELSGESESCWRKRLQKGELPFIRLGANVRVRREELERFLSDRTVSRIVGGGR